MSEFRDTKFYFTTAGSVGAAAVAAPIDAYKAAIGKVEEIESIYNTTGSFTDLSGATVLCTGAVPFQIHVFTVTTTIATGVYLMVYVETVPDASQVS
jgi:hypothetical protein